MATSSNDRKTLAMEESLALPRTSLTRKWMWQLLPFVSMLVFFVSCLVPFMISQGKQNARWNGYEVIDTYQTGPPNTDIDDTIQLGVIISDVDTVTFELVLTIEINGLPRTYRDNKQNGKLTKPIRIRAGQHGLTISPNSTSPLSTKSIRVRFMNGSLAFYPLDSYATPFVFSAYTGASPLDGQDATEVPITIKILQTENFYWKYQVDIIQDSDFGHIISGPNDFVLTLKGSRKFNVYILIVFCGIWAVTFAVAYIGSMSVIWKRRDPDNPVIFVSALFAVPNFRLTLPGQPPFGCLFDIACTYFSFGFILIFLVVKAIAYMKKTTVEND